MSLDAQVSTVISELREKFYQDGELAQTGIDSLKEMIALAKGLIKVKKYPLTEKIRFFGIRSARLTSLIEKLKETSENTQFREKYEIFGSHAREVVTISNSMDIINSNINLVVLEAIRKLRNFDREYREIQLRLSVLSRLRDFYDDAEEDLVELEGMLS